MDNFATFKRKIENTPLGQLEMSKTIVFMDWRLGLMNCILMAAAFTWCVILMTRDAFIIEPVATPAIQYWFGGEIELKALVTSAKTEMPVYCNNPSYNYNYCGPSWCSNYCPAGRLSTPFYSDHESCPDNFWDDRDIFCRSYSLEQAARKVADEGFVATLAKTLYVKSQPCDANFTCPARASTQRQWWEENDNTLNGSPNLQARVCTCKTQQDYFVMGAEKIQMTFQHGFGTNPSLDTVINGEAKNWRGSSSLDKHNRNGAQKKIHTTVYRDCPPGVSFENEQNSFDKCKRVKAFKPGELVSFSVEEWLDLAGTSLDKRVSPSAVPQDQTSEIYPTRRSVGTNLKIILTYEGRTDLSGEFRCAVTVVSPSESWGSAGHTVTYNTQRGAGSSEVTEDYVDTFYRGVKFDFTSQGNIKRFDFLVAGSYLLSTLLVIINIIPAVLRFAAFYWPNDIKAPVYRHATEEMFSFNTALADFSAGAAMASQFASTFPVNADGRVSRTAFQAILAERLSPFTAGAITDCIFTHLAQMNYGVNVEKVLTVTDEAVTQNELMRLFASNTVNMEDLLKRSFSKMEGFPSFELINLEEIRALAAVKNVTVLEDDGKDANTLGAVEQRKLKDFYVTALTSAFSLPAVKNLPADSGLDLEPGIEMKPKIVKVRVPVGATEGDVMRFTLPSGVESTAIIPAGAKAGDLISAEPPAGTRGPSIDHGTDGSTL